MGFLDRLLGRESQRPEYGSFENRQRRPQASSRSVPPGDDAAAVERYRYLLRTAPPDAVEQAHREAFDQLTPEQRRQVLNQLAAEVPASERATSDDSRSLARMATRAEMRRPGTLERSFGGGMGGGGMGMGGLIAGSLLASVAGAFVGTAIADAMFDDNGDSSEASGDSGSDDSGSDGGSDAGSDGGGADGGSDAGGFDSGGGGYEAGGFDGGGFDSGGGFGDFGGGDF